jgi:heptosyltransferase III
VKAEPMIAKRARFLVLRGGAIGDFIVTLPVLSALRERWPDSSIELIGYPHIARIALENGLVDHLDSLDRAGIATFFSLTPKFTEQQVRHIRSFDLVVSYLHDPDGTVQNNLYLAGAKQVIYGSPLVTGELHAVDHLLKPLETLAIYAAGASPQLNLSDTQRKAGAALLKERGINEAPYLIHPGSGSARKNWPVERFLALADRLRAEKGIPPLFLIGEADAAVEKALEGRLCVRDLSLPEVASLLAASRGYVGNDSGITHLAAALGLPVTALFGPSSPAQWGPRGQRVTILSAPGDGMSSIGIDDVWRALSI